MQRSLFLVTFMLKLAFLGHGVLLWSLPYSHQLDQPRGNQCVLCDQGYLQNNVSTTGGFLEMQMLAQLRSTEPGLFQSSPVRLVQAVPSENQSVWED